MVRGWLGYVRVRGYFFSEMELGFSGPPSPILGEGVFIFTVYIFY